MFVARVTRVASGRVARAAAAASTSSGSSSSASAAFASIHLAPTPAASRVALQTRTIGWTTTRGIAGDSSAPDQAEVTTVDVAALAAAKKAAREAKKAKKANSVAAEKTSEAEARRAKKESQKAASHRADQKFKDSVIEKEVPLMDLTGIKPKQNMFTNVMEFMRSEQIPSDIVSDMEQIGDFATGSTSQILSGRIANLAEKYGRKPYDTGSPEVQVAVMTERLKGYDRHMVEHKSDINSRRGFLATWHRRRKMLKYLRRTKYETYAYIMKELQLREADIDSVGLDRSSGAQAARIKRD